MTKEFPQANMSNNGHMSSSEMVEEYIEISNDRLFKDRVFDSLDLTRRNLKELTFKSCIIRKSNYVVNTFKEIVEDASTGLVAEWQCRLFKE